MGYMGLGDHSATMQWLNRAYELRASDLNFLWGPEFAPIRNDPRFLELACKIDLPPGACNRFTALR